MQFAEFDVVPYPNMDAHDQMVYYLAYMGTDLTSMFISVLSSNSSKPLSITATKTVMVAHIGILALFEMGKLPFYLAYMGTEMTSIFSSVLSVHFQQQPSAVCKPLASAASEHIRTGPPDGARGSQQKFPPIFSLNENTTRMMDMVDFPLFLNLAGFTYVAISGDHRKLIYFFGQ